MRTVIYARYSSDNQNPKSADDQIAECRARAAREGWTVLGAYSDAGISGAAGSGEAQRPGLAAALALVENGGVDQLLAESTSRLARHPADAHLIRERVEYAGARLFTLADGHVTPIVGFVKGFVDAQFRTDLAKNIRRGQRGSIADGRTPAGLGYGYRRVPRFDDRGQAIHGLREVDPDQAEVVRRIFAEFAAGRSARAIACDLNRDGVPGPKSAHWQPAALRGTLAAGHGILRNRAFVGVLVYGRTTGVRHPVTRRITFRATPPAEWTEQPAPHLRIVDDATWGLVQRRLEDHSGGRPERHRRPKRLLSGLCVCGTCGGNFVVIGDDNWGCSVHRKRGPCANNRLITTPRLEARVLAEFRARMLDPAVVTEYVREYHRNYAELAARSGRDRGRIERRVAEATRRMNNLVAAMADGGHEFAAIREQLASLRADKEAAERELASIEALPVIALHPHLADDYRREVDALERSLASNDAATIEAIPRFRAMIARVILHPSPERRGVEIEVIRHLDEVLALATTPRTANLR